MPSFSKQEKFKENSRLYLANLFFVLTRINPKQAMSLYGDLLTENEALMLAKRMEIAKGLLSGESYLSIQKRLNVTPNTVAQINKILNSSGTGFKTAYKYLQEKSN